MSQQQRNPQSLPVIFVSLEHNTSTVTENKNTNKERREEQRAERTETMEKEGEQN